MSLRSKISLTAPKFGIITCSVGFLIVIYQALTLDYKNPLYASNVSIPLTLSNLGERFFPITLITVGWFFMWYIFLFLQSYQHTLAYHAFIKKSKEGGGANNNVTIDKTKLKRGGYDLEEVDTANTMVRNTGEQSLCFLLLLWLNALYRPILPTTIAGWIWILARCLYPWVCKNVGGSILVFLSTFPGYSVQLFFAFSILLSQFTNA